jgi:hypothetical protein
MRNSIAGLEEGDGAGSMPTNFSRRESASIHSLLLFSRGVADLDSHWTKLRRSGQPLAGAKASINHVLVHIIRGGRTGVRL